MKLMISIAALALALSGVTASAQNQPQNQPNVQAPSSQNSGAGIQGLPGNKSGPPAQKGTVGSAATKDQTDQSVTNQDPANVKGLPGNKSGPPAKKPQ
jgi:hypothetical protein